MIRIPKARGKISLKFIFNKKYMLIKIWAERMIINNSFNCQWNYTGIGNNWDNYNGFYIDGNGIGESIYSIPGSGNNVNYYPLTTPNLIDINIIFVSLAPNTAFGTQAPTITLQILNPYMDSVWYRLDGSAINYTSTFPNVIINQTLWDNIIDGTYVTFHFYYNDTLGNTLHNTIVIGKDTALDGGDDDDDSSSSEKEELPWWLRAVLTGAISAIVGITIKQVYSTKKKNSELFAKMSERLDKIENLEKFLEKNLSAEEW
ncbi:MAG: hypothetical protein ACTSO9_16355, partial [Candidatus Helarchaeota archaeon]